MTLFQTVRLFSHLEVILFTSLLVVWLGKIDETAEFILGLSHGLGVIALCVMIYVGCLRKVFPWPFLAAGVLLAPVGTSIGIEWLKRRGVA